MNIFDNLNTYILQQQQQQQQQQKQQQDSLKLYNINSDAMKKMLRNNNTTNGNDIANSTDNYLSTSTSSTARFTTDEEILAQQMYFNRYRLAYDQMNSPSPPSPPNQHQQHHKQQQQQQQTSNSSLSPPIFKKSKLQQQQQQNLLYSLNDYNHLQPHQQSPTLLRKSNSSNFFTQQQQQQQQQQHFFPSSSSSLPLKASSSFKLNNNKLNNFYYNSNNNLEEFDDDTDNNFNKKNSAFSSQTNFSNSYVIENSNSKVAAATLKSAIASNHDSLLFTQPKSAYSNDESKCHVCGDKSTGSHFGGISCESCKAFFRRSVQNERHRDYKCTYQNLCEMNINTRKICQYCRYKACLNIGMKPKWVLSDSERLQKYGSRRRKLANTTLPMSTAAAQITPIAPMPAVIASFNSNTITSNQVKPPPDMITLSKTVSQDDSIAADDNSILSGYGDNDKSMLPQSPITLKNLNISGGSNSINASFTSNNNNNTNYMNSHSVSSNSSDTNSPMNSSNNFDCINDQESSDSSSKKYLESEFYKNGINSMDMYTLSIREYDKILIDKLVYAYYYARKSHEINTSGFNAEIASMPPPPPQMPNSTDQQSPSSAAAASKIAAANFIRKPVERLVTFAKLIPDFRNLAVGDQLLLLRSSAMEIIICSSISLFDKNTQTMKNMVSRDRNIEASDKQDLKLQLLRKIWPPEVFDATMKYLKSMVELNIDEATLVLYILLILFSPDRHDLNNRKRVLDLQTMYSRLLYKYLLKQRSVEEADRLYQIMLLKLIDLRNLHEIHSSILLDVDVTQFDGFPQSILKSDQEENIKLKSNSNLNSNPNSNQNVKSNSSSFELSPSFSFSTTPSTSQTEFD